MSVNGPSESGDPSTEKTELEDNNPNNLSSNPLKALSESAADFNGDVIYCREVSDLGKSVSIHWLEVFWLLKFQGEAVIVSIQIGKLSLD